MAAGRVITFATNARNNPLKEADSGLTIAPDDAEALKNALLHIYGLSQEERNDIGKKARAYVEEHYSIEVLTDKLESVLKFERGRYHA